MPNYTAFPIEYQVPNSDDIAEGITNLYMTDAEKTALALLDPNRQLPGGGLAGQRLTKIDATDYNVEWTDDPVIDVGVQTFNGRAPDGTGNITPISGDYSADIISYDPSGPSFTSLEVQGALDEAAFRLDQLPRPGHIIRKGGDLPQRDVLDFVSAYYTVIDGFDRTIVNFDDSGLMLIATYDPTGVGGDAFDLGNHTGSITLSQVSDSGALAALDTVSTSDIDDNAVTFAKMQATGAVAGPYQWPMVTVNSKGYIVSVSENVDPLARANHTGTQTMSTISDAAAIATSGNADDLSDGTNNVAMLTTERTKLGQLDPNAQLPLGGAANQVLTKNSSSNYDVSWQAAPGGGAGHVIKDQTTTFPQRTNLTFLGFTVVDDMPGDSTNVVAPTGTALEY